MRFELPGSDGEFGVPPFSTGLHVGGGDMLIAINRNIIGKASSDDLKKNNGTFEQLDISAAELADFIDQGFAFCAQHKDQWRKQSNFTAAGFLAVDIDHGLMIENAIADNFFQKYASIIYTTPSHTPEAHRFRIVFELEEPISDATEMKLALTGLIARFGGDGSCKDPCRLFFGSSGSRPAVQGKTLPRTVIDALKVRVEEIRTTTDRAGEEGYGHSAANHSRISIPRDSEIITDTGRTMKLVDVPPKTRIFCSQHVDNRPSAVTLRNKSGNPGFYCSKCLATFFLDDGRGNMWRDEYKFDYHWHQPRNITYDEYAAYMDKDGRTSLSEIRGGEIEVVDFRFLPTGKLVVGESGRVVSRPFDFFDIDGGDQLNIGDHDITFVKSPKGTGKTEWLNHLVTAHKKAKQSVLLIGHRRALISATAVRLGLTPYMYQFDAESEHDVSRTMYREPTSNFAICLDSIGNRLDPAYDKYDSIIIDEVEQVFAHLLSSTMKEERRKILHTLAHYLRSAKSIYLLDADLNRVTVEVLHEMLKAESGRSWKAIINDWRPSDRVVHLYEAPTNDHLLGELVASIDRGERCFVCSNSKALIDGLVKDVEKRCKTVPKTIAITSDNSQKSEVQKLLANIKETALDYDVIFTSPAVGTGIDITFPGGAQLIDTVFGFFQPRINTHFDIDQQLARVRNPKRINVWISPEEFQFETDEEAIKAELSLAESRYRLYQGISPDGQHQYFKDELYDSVFASITAAQRASKNRLRKNFIDLRTADGWTVTAVAKDATLAAAGRAVRKGAKEERRLMKFEALLAAPQISKDDYEKLRKNERAEKLRDADRPAMERYAIESFYYQDLNNDLLEQDNEGRLQRQIRQYELLMTRDDILQDRDQKNSDNFTSDRAERLPKKRDLVSLFEKAGIWRNGEFDIEARITSSHLNDFSAECVRKKTGLERRFNVAVRRDVFKKPIQQLNDLLDLVGLCARTDGRSQKGGQSVTSYRLDEERLAVVSEWADLRANRELVSAWREARETLDDE